MGLGINLNVCLAIGKKYTLELENPDFIQVRDIFHFPGFQITINLLPFTLPGYHRIVPEAQPIGRKPHTQINPSVL
jgi:hypothetical protein